MKRLALGIIYVVLFYAVSHLGGGGGLSLQCSGNRCLVTASSSLLAIVLGLTIFFGILALPKRQVTAGREIAGFARMIGALIADVSLVVIGFAAIFAVPMLLVEESYTGTFQWDFRRDFTRTTDWVLAFVPIFAVIPIVFLLRLRAMKLSVPSLGQYLMGYVVLADKGRIDFKTAIKRFGWAAVYLPVWPLYLLCKSKTEKHAWDERTKTNSVKFEYK